MQDSELWFGAPEPPESPQNMEPVSLDGLISSRWAVAVLRELRRDAVRYNELHRRLGSVSHKVLTETLRRMQRAGIVVRRPHPTLPLHVEYHLTACGAELLRNLDGLERWAGTWGLQWSGQSQTSEVHP
jgi:DNA-binding HxlR family transcriptional regulator